MRSVRAAGDSWICTETRPNVSAPFHVAAICSPFAEELECYGFISGQRNRRKIGVANGTGEGEAKMPLAFGISHFRDFGASDISELAANRIRGESGAQEAAIKRCDSALVDRTSNLCELPFDAPANEGGFVSFCEDGVESGL